MKNLLTTTLLAIFCLGIYAQTPSWQWAKSAGGNRSDGAQDVTTDSKGNVYVTGYFMSQSITFGTISLNIGGLGLRDYYIAKFDSSGNIKWAKSVGFGDQDYGTGITTDDNGNVYVTGMFMNNSITFGSISLTNSGRSDIFIVKYDSSGNVLWAKSIGGASNDYESTICTDPNGNVYVTGKWDSDSIILGTTTLKTTGGDYDFFIAKYNGSGNLIWAMSQGSATGDVIANDISTDKSGNIFVTGEFNSTSVTFGTATLSNVGNGTNDIFIAKYDASGNVIWAKSAGGNEGDQGNSIATDYQGNAYITGAYNSLSLILDTTTLIKVGTVSYSDFFVVKYDSSGKVLWAKSSGALNNDEGTKVLTDKSGNAYVTGSSFLGTKMKFGTITLPGTGFLDIFVVKYDNSGNAVWAISADGTNIENGNGISIDATGNIYACGEFISPSVTFGLTTINNSGGGQSDIFVAKIKNATPSSIIITSQPANQSKCNGSPVTFMVAATGNNLNYQWKKNGVAITGAINDTFIISAVSLSDTGIYSCTISDTGYSVTSNGAKLTVGTIHSISSHPVNETKCVGQPATFSVTASGYCVSYQWRKNGSNISGATKSSYTIVSVSAADSGNYDVVVSGVCIAPITSSKASLTVNTLPAITTQPSAVSKCVGENAAFSVTATGTGISYQWRKNGNNITGANSSSYAISNVFATDAGSYDVVITGICSPSVTSNSATLTVNNSPAVTTHPVSQVKKTTQSVTFTVAASGTTLTYQWQKNGTDITGATSASYTKTNLVQADSGNFRCIVTNACGKDTSNTANLKVDKLIGINDFENDRQFSIYPNPASGFITIETTVSNIFSELQIFDIHGREVMQKRITEPNTTINISHLPQGLYYFSLKDQKSVYFEKIIKQ